MVELGAVLDDTVLDGRAYKRPLPLAPRMSDTGAMASRLKPKNDNFFFAAPGGFRRLLQTAAKLEGQRLQLWMREALFAEAVRVLEKHGVEGYELPKVHLERPKPLPRK
ncbi:MAG: hypothetical protein K8H88_07275 [Sandaracinaceae bacterium]|nr:hypothetical protein [Sandaracinaceae bacterium]